MTLGLLVVVLLLELLLIIIKLELLGLMLPGIRIKPVILVLLER